MQQIPHAWDERQTTGQLHYLHDGSLTTLEEMFDPARLQDTFVPTGFVPPERKTHAVTGHTFGLKLPPSERAALIAFLKSL